MQLQPVPVLGLDGWVYTPREKMDNLFLHFVEANRSQSVLSRESVYSFQYILATCQQAEEKLVADLKTALTQYFGPPYFASVDVGVNVIEDPTRGGALILQIFLEAKDEHGKSFNIAKVSSDITSKTIRWANLNNYGDENQFAQ